MVPVHNAAGQDLDTIRDKNNSSIAWVLSAGAINYYTAGDLEDEDHLIGTLRTKPLQVIKCGHHGSAAATSGKFLDAMKPTVAIIQGPHPVYPHPPSAVLSRLGSRKIKTFATSCHVQYGSDVPMPTVCGGARHAGDVVITIWSDDTSRPAR